MALSATYDLVVAGGGPAGSAAALGAARQGARVLLLERGRLPRQKVCGEFVSPEAVTTLQRMVGGDAAARQMLDAAVHIRRARLLAGEQQVETLLEPAAAGLSRFDLDAMLWRVAETAGAECRQGVEVEDITGQAAGFRVRSSAGEFVARAVVNAAGRWSRLTPQTGQAGRAHWLGLKAHFAAEREAESVDLYFFPGGYCGVQPVRMQDGEMRLNVCTMVQSDAARTLEQVLTRDPSLWRRSREWEPVAEAVTTSPLHFAPPEAVREGVLQAGDAAGFIDPFLGDGISLALHSGKMAAEALREVWTGRASAGEAALHYEESYRKELLPAFRRARRLRQALRFPAAALRLMQVPGVAGYVVRRTRVGA